MVRRSERSEIARIIDYSARDRVGGGKGDGQEDSAAIGPSLHDSVVAPAGRWAGVRALTARVSADQVCRWRSSARARSGQRRSRGCRSWADVPRAEDGAAVGVHAHVVEHCAGQVPAIFTHTWQRIQACLSVFTGCFDGSSAPPDGRGGDAGVGGAGVAAGRVMLTGYPWWQGCR